MERENCFKSKTKVLGPESLTMFFFAQMLNISNISQFYFRFLVSAVIVLNVHLK